MPSLNPIKILGHLEFNISDKRIPHNWQEPLEMPQRGHFARALTPEEKIVIPNMPIAFYKPENLNRYHQDACNMIGGQFRDFHDAIVDAVKEAHDQWRMQAGFTGLQIMALAAIGTPGCLVGPDLEPLIKNASGVASMEGNEAAYRDAVAGGIGKCFKAWQSAVTVPGLPWYPAFVAFPSPVAPPTPNVPVPLIMCMSPMVVQLLVPGIMRKMMELSLSKDVRDKDEDKKYKSLFKCIEATMIVAFAIWLVSQQVTNVMGTGPIPTFAPPFVPVGPVVGGTNLPGPGQHVMA